MKCVEGTPIRNEQGFYIQTWETTSMSSSEIEEITVSKREEVRRIRNNKLKECDWVVISFYGDENIMTDEVLLTSGKDIENVLEILQSNLDSHGMLITLQNLTNLTK